MNILPNKQILWWSLPYTNNKVANKLFLMVDTVLSYNNDTYDSGFTNLNTKIGMPPGAENYTIMCSISNPYVRMYTAWREACLKKYKVLPTLKEWFKINAGIKAKLTTYSESDLSTTTDFLLENAKNILNREPDYFINSDSLKEGINKIPQLQSPLLTDTIFNSIVETITLNEKNSFMNSISNGKIINTNKVDLFSSWKNNYDDELAELVYSLLEKDFIQFNFDKDSWKQ
jgi:hypothetical protein